MFEGVRRTPEAVAQIVAELVLDGAPIAVAHDLPERLRRVEPRDLKAFVREAFPRWAEMLRIVVAPGSGSVAADCVIDATETAEAFAACR
jgi:hypothetical protein